MTEGIKRTLLQSQVSRSLFAGLQSLFYAAEGAGWPHLRNRYAEDGIVLLPGFFSRELCEAALAEMDKMVEASKRGQLPAEIRTIDNEQVYANGERVIYAFDFSESNTHINALVFDPRIREICEYINRSRLKVIQHWAKRVYPASNAPRRLMNESWHQDGGGLSLVRFIVYLNDITADQGPFQYARASHRKPVSRESCYTGEADIMSCEGRQGDVIIANVTGGWHRATPVNAGQRNTLQVALSSPAADRINRLFKFGSYLQK